MAFVRRRSIRLVLFCVVLLMVWQFSCTIYGTTSSINVLGGFSKYPSKETTESLFLNEQQCRATFPGLTKEIDDAVARGPFVLDKKPDDYQGLVQARIKDGKLYVISVERRPSRDMLHVGQSFKIARMGANTLQERQSVLYQIHRALVTSPTPLPDTVFSFSIIDYPRQDAWSFSRSNDPNIKGNYWVMPHFSFWSWPKPFLGTMDQALDGISAIENRIPWEKKIDKAVWRGTAWFNSVGNTALRPHLLAATKDQDWADVEDLRWETNGIKAKNSIGIEDFCKYKYIIYTEGVTYSGRLPFHQACRSIILTPPPSYMMHTTHQLRPLFSSTLPFSPSYNSQTAPPPHNPRWPDSYSPSKANIIFVEPDWSDLHQTIEWLRAHPEVAEGIANRQRESTVDKGLLSPAAEVCYWRSLVRGWSSVVEIEEGAWGEWEREGGTNGEGMRFESFALTGETKWESVQ
ncbi:O-glucosyltransferase rumi-like protein [Lachnellula arida]|uniref:O-glucosyltransferase rumi-like protein n=1 Tax=Lachnellula arida TaxID=1316785 RepID=A0A8T9B7X9_9HELO|nr:O-glucosyltransferase rumi-like protein [Lachnellula arida]